MPTLGESLVQIREMEGREAVLRTLSGYLRLRYISRDSTPATAQIRAHDGSPVSEDIIANIATEMDREAAALDKAVKAAKATEVSDA